MGDWHRNYSPFHNGAAIHEQPLKKIQPRAHSWPPLVFKHFCLLQAVQDHWESLLHIRFALIPSCSTFTSNNSSHNPKLGNSSRDVAVRQPSSNYQNLQAAGNPWQLEEPSYIFIARVQSEQVPPEACHCMQQTQS